MRQEKFNIEQSDDDINYALNHNGYSDLLKEIDVIVAEVCGANDEDSWYWILQKQNGKFVSVEASCDYTGWDCQSSATVGGECESPEQSIEALELPEYEKRPNINALAIVFRNSDTRIHIPP